MDLLIQVIKKKLRKLMWSKAFDVKYFFKWLISQLRFVVNTHVHPEISNINVHTLNSNTFTYWVHSIQSSTQL